MKRTVWKIKTKMPVFCFFLLISAYKKHVFLYETFNRPIIYNKQFHSNLMAFQEVGEKSQSRVQKLYIGCPIKNVPSLRSYWYKIAKVSSLWFWKHVVIPQKFMHMKNQNDIGTLSIIFSVIENGLKLQKSDLLHFYWNKKHFLNSI